MEVLREIEACRPGAGSVVTIGAYDGVHLGHQAVIGEVRRRAEAAGLASAVVTFDRHPAAVVRPESAPRLLTDLEQKLELLAATGGRVGEAARRAGVLHRDVLCDLWDRGHHCCFILCPTFLPDQIDDFFTELEDALGTRSSG